MMADRTGNRDCSRQHSIGHGLAVIANLLRKESGGDLDAGIICGSGLRELSGILADRREIERGKIPGLESLDRGNGSPVIHLGRVGKKRVVVFGKRLHLYEGFTPWETVMPVRIISELGARFVILTCAAGSLRRALKPGAIVVIRDHLNLTFANPGRGLPAAPGVRFVDLSDPYDAGLVDLAREVAGEEKIRIEEGAIASVTGPSYETRAEAGMLRALGADLVTMSMVLETIVSRMAGMKVMGLSSVTNYAPFDGMKGILTHHEVLATARKTAPRVSRLIAGVIRKM